METATESRLENATELKVVHPETSRDSFNDESSSSVSRMSNEDSLVENDIISKDMIEEERLMAKESAKEEFTLKQQYQEELKTQEELEKKAQYKRLMHLLNKSQFYMNFLVKKIAMCNQQEELRKAAKKKEDERKADIEARSLKVINSLPVKSENTTPKKNPKKRPAKINDLIDEEAVSNAKKRRVEEDSATDQKKLKVKGEEKDEVTGTHLNSMGLLVPDGQPDMFEGGVLRHYQLQGVEWMKALFENGVNGILADEMGLGKTVQVIALLCHLVEKGVLGPFLIVAPLSTLPNWLMEFERFAPQLPVILFHGSKYTRPTLYKKLKTKVRINGKIAIAPVVLTSYQVPISEKKFMSTFNWRYIIVDEGHAIKNFNTQLARTLRSFRSVNRLLLTGTPLQNNLTELWSLLNFLLPEVFDDLADFQSMFAIEALTSDSSIKQEESHVIGTLHQILTPFLLRRLKSDVELMLPSKKEVLVYAPLTDLQMTLYKATIEKVIEDLLRKDRQESVLNEDGTRKARKCRQKEIDYTFKKFDWFGEDSSKEEIKEEKPQTPSSGVWTSIKMSNPEMQLRKIANHPYLVQMPIEMQDDQKVMVVSDEVLTSSGKMMVLSQMLKALHQRGHKVLIFSYFKIMLNLIEEFCVMRDYPYLRLDGDDDIEVRKANIRTFNTDPNIFVFMLTTRAGGLGLNLTAADTVIIFDSDYNPQVDLQAMDRCHRIGQTRPVIIYRYVSKGTVEEKILKVANQKRRLEKIVIQKGMFKMSGESRTTNIDEFRRLLESVDHQKTVNADNPVFTDDQLEELLDRSAEKEEGASHFQVLNSQVAK